MIGLIIGTLIAGYAAAEIYKKYAKPQEKEKWQNFVNMHHGEAGAIMAGVGIISKSPNLIGSGLGLMLHDKADSKKWFNGVKY